MGLALSNESSIKNAKKRVMQEYKKKFHSSANKITDWNQYTGSSLPVEVMDNPKFQQVCNYGYDLFFDVLQYKPKMPSELFKEIMHWEKEGALCIHISIIMYHLFKEEKVIAPTAIHFVQGYYYHKTQAVHQLSMMLGEEHVGLHAWLLVKGAVVDMTIGQQRDFFHFQENPFILGKVPEGLLLEGKNEPAKVIDKYTKSFAKHLKVSKEEWIEKQITYFNDWSNNKK